MRSLGNTIKDKRSEGNISLSDLEKETRIRKEFLSAIENSTWEKLPEYPVVQGFVRSIAHVLETDEELFLALLRRDYPKRDLLVNPKPDVKNKFIWSPRWTLIAGVFFVSLIIVGYLGYQYKQFVSPPQLTITTPQEDEVITKSIYTVTGRTSEDATIIINNQPTLINDDGTFTEDVEISKETKEIDIRATSRAGKVTEVRRKVKVEL
jgi:cytoskeletal protein RodZ